MREFVRQIPARDQDNAATQDVRGQLETAPHHPMLARRKPRKPHAHHGGAGEEIAQEIERHVGSMVERAIVLVAHSDRDVRLVSEARDELGQFRIARGSDSALFRGHAEHLHGARDVLRIRDEEAIGKRRRMRGGDDDGIGAVCSNASRNFFVAIDGGLDGSLLAFADARNDEWRMGNSVSSDDRHERPLFARRRSEARAECCGAKEVRMSGVVKCAKETCSACVRTVYCSAARAGAGRDSLTVRQQLMRLL